jgi:putative transposase
LTEIQTTIAENIQEQQRLCDTWRTEFTHVRPHEALGMKTPSEIYRPSGLCPIVRAGGLPQDCQRRVVDDRVWLRYEMLHVYVAAALAGYALLVAGGYVYWTVGPDGVHPSMRMFRAAKAGGE